MTQSLPSHEAYLGLGSNLGDSVQTLKSAIQSLSLQQGIELLAISSFYQTPPVGPKDQPDYLNAATRIRTSLSPYELLNACQEIEQQHHRKRTLRWGPRTLDIDILLFDDLGLNDPDLIIPHPEMHRRAFVLAPLIEIAPKTLSIPGHGSVTELLKDCWDPSILKVTP